MRKCILFVFLVILSIACADDQQINLQTHAHNESPGTISDSRLRDMVKDHFPSGNVFIGATTSFESTKEREGRILAREFSYITPANDFKQTYIHPEPNLWKWGNPDGWVKFAAEHHQLIRMHGPISPQCSDWAQADNRSPQELEQNLKEYMTALCNRYNGNKNIRWMDVINETVNQDGSWKRAMPGTGWEMPWEKIGYDKTPAKFKNLGGKIPKYIIQAFQIATEHAPDVKLIINQHAGMEKPMWDKVKDMVLYLRSIGCRVDGIGWQAHIKLMKTDANQWETGAINNQNLSDLISWAHSNQLEFLITENNLQVDPSHEGNQDEHADVFTGILKTLLEKRGGGVVALNFWDIEDTTNYQKKNVINIGLWGRRGEPKKAYYGVLKLIENPPPVK